MYSFYFLYFVRKSTAILKRAQNDDDSIFFFVQYKHFHERNNNNNTENNVYVWQKVPLKWISKKSHEISDQTIYLLVGKYFLKMNEKNERKKDHDIYFIWLWLQFFLWCVGRSFVWSGFGVCVCAFLSLNGWHCTFNHFKVVALSNHRKYKPSNCRIEIEIRKLE